MRARGATIQGALAGLGMLAAYGTWQREPERAAGEVTVLDIGVATGYSSAVLARLAGRVVAVESDSTLAAQATVVLSGIDNVRLVTGALPEGFAGEGPYDAILINGAVASVPPELLDQLKDRGRLVAIQIERGVGRATLWRRFATTYDQRILFDAGAPVLPGFERKAEFVF